MTNIETTVDSFIDGVPVDPAALDAALASADGRAYLIDALALRQLMSDEPAAAPNVKRERPRVLRFVAAAVVGLGLLGCGYAAGARATATEPVLAPTMQAGNDVPPEPTRVIELKAGVNWHETKGGD